MRIAGSGLPLSQGAILVRSAFDTELFTASPGADLAWIRLAKARSAAPIRSRATAAVAVARPM